MMEVVPTPRTRKPAAAKRPALLEIAEKARTDGTARLVPERRAELGQYLTPAPIARFMAAMFGPRRGVVRILDAGAGSGSLTAAAVAEFCSRVKKPTKIEATVYEVEPALQDHLRQVLDACHAECRAAGVEFEAQRIERDFIDDGVRALRSSLFSSRTEGPFDLAILNPPYRKIQSDSKERRLLRVVGIETSNLYSAFVGLAVNLLAVGGELVAITPRSFCNGPYFEPFRRHFLAHMRFRHIHVFDARDVAFSGDAVLQENVIYHAVKTAPDDVPLVMSSSRGPESEDVRRRTVEHARVAPPDDRHAFIHVVPNELDDAVRRQMGALPATLVDLGIRVSTGRVVDFRATELLLKDPTPRSVPLIYPGHFEDGYVAWPKPNGKKANALALGPGADELLVPAGNYVLVKRFSAKEETRRVVAAVYDGKRVPGDRVGFENHLNYFHVGGAGMPLALAKGLAVFLNSTLVDAYFRQFSGHTQVNATDLRNLRYPSIEQLKMLGRKVGKSLPNQEETDRLILEIVFDGREAA